MNDKVILNKSYIMTDNTPYAFGLGQPFYDEEDGLIAARWLTTNIGNGTHTEFLYFIMKTLKIQYPTETHSFVLKQKDSANILQKFNTLLPGLRSSNENFDILRNSVNNLKKLLVIIYPTEEDLTKKEPIDAVDVLCRLTMISNLRFRPNELNLNGIFDHLHELVYTSDGVLTEKMYRKKFLDGSLDISTVLAQERIPPLYWGTTLPKGVRVADIRKIRLGAYLHPGTTVMHDGSVKHNAGTMGPSMIEGRISAGVVVGSNSDIGGGASIMGTLSGGGTIQVSIGENCLLGANSGTGISLGNRSTIEAGLYITKGKKIIVKSRKFKKLRYGDLVKAELLSGKSDMLFLQNSITGQIELHWNTKPNKLNRSLHTTG
jgi:2,3,4,5-tetrahydropyridine-2-carboxylate N-succinyltransferase